MVARRLLVPGIVLLVAVPICVVVLALVLRDGSESRAETRREATVRPTVTTSVQPLVHRFGEPLTARIELTVRKAEIDPSTARPSTDVEPYVALEQAQREVDEFGALDSVVFTVPIQCLRQACLPETQTGEFTFGTAQVNWRRPAPPGRRFADRRLDQRNARGEWPDVKVASWLTPADVEQARWRSSLGDLPEASYAVSPRWLVAGLTGGAIALVLLAAGLLGGAVRELAGRREVQRAAEPEPEPLDRAVALVEESRANGDLPGRRVALETLARELRLGGDRVLAADAERLAWSPSPPPDAEIAALLADVRTNGAGG